MSLINHDDRARQLVLFDGLRYGKNLNMMPTDIDGFMEIRNKVFVLFEIKTGDKAGDWGQMTALERLADAIPHPTLLLLAKHYVPADCDIQAHECIVTKFRYNKTWFDAEGRTIRRVMDDFLRKHKMDEFINEQANS